MSKLSIAFVSVAFAAAIAAPICPNGATPFEGTGRGATESKARENANQDIASGFATIKVNILDELTQKEETNKDMKEYANYQRKIKITSELDTKYVKDAEPPYKENGQFVAKRYLCPSDAAKPYLDSLKNINQRISIQKMSNSFCETLYKTYSPRVMLFERILERLGEKDESRIANYKKAEKECEEMSAYIKKGYVGFEEALDKAVAEIVSKRGKAKTKIVIAEIYVPSGKLSDFIKTELETKLVKVKTFTVKPAISKGQKVRIGPMLYSEAMEIGRDSKADIVLIGGFDPYAGYSYFTLKALETQPPPKTIAMNADKIRPGEAALAALMPGKLTEITDDVLAHLNKGKDLYMEGKFDEAIGELSKALAMNGDLSDAYHYRGVAYSDKGNHDKAIEDLNVVVRLRPDYALAIYGRGTVYLHKGNYDLAIEDLNKAIKIEPDNIYALSNRGLAYASKGNYDKAIEDYNAALKIDPNFLLALNNRGSAYVGKGNYDKAIEDLNAALKIKPDYDTAMYNRGNAYYNKGNIDQAIQDFNAALRINPDLYQAINDRGVAYDDKGDYDQAMEDYNAVLRINPNYESALNNRGNVYYSKGDYNRAIEDFTAALKINPNSLEARFNRGNAYLNMDNYDRAIEDYTAALRIMPDLYNALQNRGTAYFNKENYDLAIKDYTAALRIKPDDILALNNRGSAYYNKGDHNRAIEDWEAVLRIDPDNEDTKQNIEMARKERVVLKQPAINSAWQAYQAVASTQPAINSAWQAYRAVASTQSAGASSAAAPTSKSGDVKIGVRAGFNLYDFSYGNEYKEMNEYLKMGNGLGGGLAINIPIVKFLTLAPEINFYSATPFYAERENVEIKINEFALSIPVMLQLMPFESAPLYVASGVQFDLPFVSKTEIKVFGTKITGDDYLRASVDIGIPLGLGYYITPNFRIDSRMVLGLTELEKGEEVKGSSYKQFNFGLTYYGDTELKASSGLAIALDLIGTGLIVAGYERNRISKKAFDDVYMVSGQTPEYYKEVRDVVETKREQRNRLYIIGGLILASGLGVHICF